MDNLKIMFSRCSARRTLNATETLPALPNKAPERTMLRIMIHASSPAILFVVLSAAYARTHALLMPSTFVAAFPYCAASPARSHRTSRLSRRRQIRMDDEIARQGIKEELTTRDEYLATRFTKLSASGHDLTPLNLAETQEAAANLLPIQKTLLFGGDAQEPYTGDMHESFRDCREKGLYACAVGGLPLFTSGWKLEPGADDDSPIFAEPCDDEHLIEEHDPEQDWTFVSCARSRVRVGTVVQDSASPSGKRYTISSAALEFHPLGKALPVRCQPENYWGSEGQYRAWGWT